MYLSPRLILPFTPLIYILLAREISSRNWLKRLYFFLILLTIPLSFSSPARGPKLREAKVTTESFGATIVHTAPTTFYPSLISKGPTPNLYIGPQIFPSELSRRIGGIPTAKAQAFSSEEFTLVTDTRNTLPAVRESAIEFAARTYVITDTKELLPILIQRFSRVETRFAKDRQTIGEVEQ